MQIPMNQLANNGMNIMNQNNFNNINNNQFQGNSNQQQQSNNFITVFFREGAPDNQDTNSPKIAIQCMPDEKVSDIIQRYRTKANFNGEAKFIFNAKNLAPSLSVAEAGITNSSYVFVVKTEGIKGAY